MGELVLYLPRGGHRATGYIARGAAIVGAPRAGSREIEISVEEDIFGPDGVRTLAERASRAAERLLGLCPRAAARLVPREALLAVGAFDPDEGRIELTGPNSEAAMAAWLGTLRLDPAELEQPLRGRPRARDVAHLVPDVSIAVTSSLAEALIERAGIVRDAEEGWTAGDGRRTSAISER